MLKLINLTKTFYQRKDEVTVINKLSLEVKKGEVFGFLGPNGAGKTTTVKMITDLIFPTSGTILINNKPANSLESKKIIGFMSEQPQFYRYLKAHELMELSGALCGLKGQELKNKSVKLLEMVGLKKSIKQNVKDFSKGMTQRLAFASALINDPKLIILDEPLDGLDPLGRLDFKKMLLDQKKIGKTIFFNTHILSDVEEICDRVAIINKGKVLEIGSPRQLMGTKFKTLEEKFVEVIKNA